MGDERPNAHMIFLPTELFVGLVKKMAKYEVGRSAAILDSINEDLHRRGFVDDEAYEKFKQQYMKKLVDVVREKEKATLMKRIEPEKLKLQKTLVMVTEQWDIHDQQRRQKWISKAKELEDTIPEAKEILRKAGVLNE